MRRKIIHVALLSILIPIVASAASSGGASGCAGGGICNPLNPDFSTIPTFISGVLRVMVQVGLPVVAFFFLLAGYRFVSAGGSEGKLSEAKENFKWVFLGACLILGAWVLATLIGNTVSQVVGAPYSF